MTEDDEGEGACEGDEAEAEEGPRNDERVQGKAVRRLRGVEPSNWTIGKQEQIAGLGRRNKPAKIVC